MSEQSKTSTKVTIIGEVINIRSNRGYTDYVIKDDSGEYDSILCITFKDDKLQYPPKEGDEVEASGYVSSKEWNGKYFTNTRGSFMKKLSGGSDSGSSNQSQSQEPSQDENPFSEEDPYEDDVPF